MISVVVPVFNTGKYLDRCIDSLLAQTYKDMEILIVDDGSTDGSGAVCDAQCDKSPLIQVFHKANGGLSSARNYGMARAKGEFIIFPDPDDWVEPEYLQKLLFIQESNQADMGICGFYLTYGKKDVFGLEMTEPLTMNRDEAMKYLIRPYAFSGSVWNKLFRTKIIQEHHLLFDEDFHYAEDLHFCVRYFQYCDRFAYHPIALYHYSQDTGGVTRFSALNQRKLSGLLAYKKITELLQTDYPNLAEIEYSKLCGKCLSYIYMYYYFRTRDRETLRMLTRTYTAHRKSFYAAEVYTPSQKRFSHIAWIWPWLYYLLRRIQEYCGHIKAVLKNKMEIKRDGSN